MDAVQSGIAGSIGWMLRSMTGLGYQRIALVFALSFPLHRNLLFGQFYLLLLALLTAACWAYLRKYYVLAGVLVAIATACKIFPALLFVFFLQRRSWRALLAGVVTGLAALTISLAVFGWNLHRTYLHEILPWALRGEGLPPYITSSASISSFLHYYFSPSRNGIRILGIAPHYAMRYCSLHCRCWFLRLQFC